MVETLWIVKHYQEKFVVQNSALAEFLNEFDEIDRSSVEVKRMDMTSGWEEI